jgi:hypothetical protein
MMWSTCVTDSGISGITIFPVASEELFPQYIQTRVLIILKLKHVGCHDAIQTVNLKIAYLNSNSQESDKHSSLNT